VLWLMISGGAGEPSWSIECSGVVEDTCAGEAAGTTLEVKNEVNGTVDMFFNEQTGSCARGGAKSALINGLVIILNVTTGLSVEVMGS